jgi:hypothetical protein
VVDDGYADVLVFNSEFFHSLTRVNDYYIMDFRVPGGHGTGPVFLTDQEADRVVALLHEALEVKITRNGSIFTEPETQEIAKVAEAAE